MKKTGVLLLNLGTPDAPDTESVRRYLDEFLMDPYVIDLPWIFRVLLVRGIILRTRPKRSAAAYRKVWTSRGSPLAFHTIDLAEKVQESLGSEYLVRPVMRYGKPHVSEALQEFVNQGIDSVVVLPLYPQYAVASTKSSEEWVKKQAELLKFKGKIKFIGAFYNNESFLSAFAEKVIESRTTFTSDHLLFSFHGLPEQAVRKLDRSGGNHCLVNASCCDVITDVNRECYRAQCFFTARRIAEKVGLSKDQYQVTFQSRLGPTQWIRPYSDVVLKELGASGRVKNLLVVSPSFVADCLETLEEIAIRSRVDFIKSGGEDLRMVPSLNSSDRWVECVTELVLRALDD